MSFGYLLTTTHHTSDPMTFESCELKTLARKDSLGKKANFKCHSHMDQGMEITIILSIFLRIEPNVFLCI